MSKNKLPLGEVRHANVDVAKTDLHASSVTLGELEHPNKLPFSGTLTWFNTVSDNSPHGSKGYKIMIPAAVGTPALSSLVGMAVNFKASWDNHSPQDKIGVITEAYTGDPAADGAVPVYINGYIYAYDFEDAALAIKANQANLGFSFETKESLVKEGIFDGENVLVVTDVGYFTGASVLLKQSAAYTKTSIAASKEGNADVNFEEMLAQLKQHIDTRFEELKAAPVAEETPADENAAAEVVVAEVVAGETAVEVAVASETTAEVVTADATTVETTVETTAEVTAEATAEATEEVTATATEEATEVVEEVVAEEQEELQLAAAAELVSVKAELEAAKAELTSLKETANLQAAARKSIAYPVSLLSKYDIKETDEKANIMASIETNKDLSLEERLAMKFELREKQRKSAE